MLILSGMDQRRLYALIAYAKYRYFLIIRLHAKAWRTRSSSPLAHTTISEAAMSQSLTCLQCATPYAGRVKRSFLGFRKFTCAACGSVNTYPLTRGVKITYYIGVAFFGFGTIATWKEGRGYAPGILFFGMVIALWQNRALTRKIQPTFTGERRQQADATIAGSWKAGMAFAALVVVGLIVLGLALRPSPEKVARSFIEGRIRMDPSRIYAVLSSRDTFAVRRADFKHLNPAVFPFSYDPWYCLLQEMSTDRLVLDSVRPISRTDTSAMVEGFLHGPAFELAGARIPVHERFKESLATLRDRYFTEVAILPVRPFVDTTYLIREHGQWRVQLNLPERKLLAPLRVQVDYEGADYMPSLSRPISKRAAVDAQFLAAAEGTRNIVADSEITNAQNIVQRGAIADSLTFALALHTLPGVNHCLTAISGRIYNTSHTNIRNIALRIVDSFGNSGIMSFNDPLKVIGAGAVTVLNNNGEAGTIECLHGSATKVEVLDLETSP